MPGIGSISSAGLSRTADICAGVLRTDRGVLGALPPGVTYAELDPDACAFGGVVSGGGRGRVRAGVTGGGGIGVEGPASDSRNMGDAGGLVCTGAVDSFGSSGSDGKSTSMKSVDRTCSSSTVTSALTISTSSSSVVLAALLVMFSSTS